MRFFSLLVVASLLCCCASSSEKPASRKFKGGYRYLVDIYREDGTNFVYGLGPTSLQFFNCSEAELAELRHAELVIQRIGEGSGNVGSPRVRLGERASSRLLKELTDYGNYMDRSACQFEPVVRFVAETSKGKYQFDVCFSCKDIQIKLPTGEVRSPHLGPKLGRCLLDGAREAFPGDKVLREVKLKW